MSSWFIPNLKFQWQIVIAFSVLRLKPRVSHTQSTHRTTDLYHKPLYKHFTKGYTLIILSLKEQEEYQLDLDSI